MLYDSVYIKYPEEVNLQRWRVDYQKPKPRVGVGAEGNGHRVSFWDDENVSVQMMVIPH